MSVEKAFIDTNILVYAYDKDAGKKQLKAKKIVEECIRGNRELYLSNQILAEFINVALNKLSKPPAIEEITNIIVKLNKIDSWKKINYSNKTVESALHENGNYFWDKLIAATMKENNVFTIYTENTKDFKEMAGIQAINPF
ncbi:MAG: PIN domain-containing protein [Candidatus Diapherotrites archaeon]|nr:PIN domain-containing protein [Candidatus Diapherotrites archaeon]